MHMTEQNMMSHINTNVLFTAIHFYTTTSQCCSNMLSCSHIACLNKLSHWVETRYLPGSIRLGGLYHTVINICNYYGGVSIWKLTFFPFVTISCQKLRYKSCLSQELWHICQNRTIIKTNKLVQWSSVLVKFYVMTWNLRIHYHVHSSSPLMPVLSQNNPSSLFIVCLFLVHNIFSYMPTSSKKCLSFLQDFWPICCMHVSSSLCMLCACSVLCSFHTLSCVHPNDESC